MRHVANPRFWRAYHDLPKPIQELADRAFAILKEDAGHPSLHFKKVGGVWSARVGIHHRALAAEQGDDLVWFWIGSHAEYDRLVAGTGARRRATTKQGMAGEPHRRKRRG